MFKKYIKLAYENKQHLKIYRDYDKLKIIYGKIFYLSKYCLGIIQFDDVNEYNGITIISDHNISRISWSQKENDKNHPIRELPKIKSMNLEESIKEVNDFYDYVILYMEEINPDVFYFGKLVHIDDNVCVLREYRTLDEFGQSDLYLSLDYVTRIEADSKYARGLLAGYH